MSALLELLVSFGIAFVFASVISLIFKEIVKRS
jgi:hypothetical protein